MEEIVLKTPSAQGRIRIGEGVINQIPLLTRGQKNFVLTDSNVYAIYPAFFKKYFKDCEIFALSAGEENKSLENLCKILGEMVKAGLHRTSKLFAVGGGVIGDIGGLAAATYMRGISLVQIPTTLLAQIDSSVGGKTAVDYMGVKNVVGAFYQPSEVLIEPAFLSTLPSREVKCGVGEIVKYAGINGEIYRSLSQNKEKIKALDLKYFKELIPLCVRHKAAVVEMDEWETGERKALNVGHTTGHAIELFYGLSHGESVLYGMALETLIAVEKGVCEKEYGESILEILRIALSAAPISSPDFSSVEGWAEKAKSDKKNGEEGSITLSVTVSEGGWGILTLSFEEYVEGLKRALKRP